ncbi:MAG: hypothetical protein ACHQ1D_12450, partial [Nitrososphaerales archaeon]
MQKNKQFLIFGIISIVFTIILINFAIPDKMKIKETDFQPQNPRPPPTSLDEYGIETSLDEIKIAEKTSWVNEPSVIPEGFVFKSIRSNGDNLVAMIYGTDELGKVRSTFEENYRYGIVVVYSVDEGVTSEDWKSYITEQVRLDPVHRHITTIDGSQVYVEEAEDAYDRPARTYFRNGDQMVVAVSSVAHPSDLEKLVRSTIRYWVEQKTYSYENGNFPPPMTLGEYSDQHVKTLEEASKVVGYTISEPNLPKGVTVQLIGINGDRVVQIYASPNPISEKTLDREFMYELQGIEIHYE